MKILSLHIYGFGKFIDKKIEPISPNFQLFYGENEAGKSTILAFIRSILFGFPAKQSKEERYEPKLASVYGGKVTIELNPYGKITIERIKGKSRGEVKVYMPDGTIEGEEMLAKLFAGMDKTVFQNIFSFGLQDLNDFSQVQSEEIGRFLYGVGMLGRTSIIELEKHLQKKQEQLFRPQGKKPFINALFYELDEKQEKLNSLKKEEQKYYASLIEKERLHKEIAERKEKIRHLKEKISEFEMLSRLERYVRKRNYLQKQIHAHRDMLKSFPADGEKRLAEYHLKLETAQERIAEIEKNIQLLKEKRSHISVHRDLLQRESEIIAFQQKIGKYEHILLEKKSLAESLDRLHDEIRQLLGQLGDDWNEEKLGQAQTTVQAKDELLKLAEEEKKRFAESVSLENDLQEKERWLKEKNAEKERLKEKLAFFGDINEIKQKLQMTSEKLTEKRLLAEEISLLKTKRSSKQEKNKQSVFILFSILCFLLLVFWGLFSHEWFVSIVGLFSIAMLVFVLYEKKGGKKQKENDQLLKQKLAFYEQLENEHLEEKEKELSLQLERFTQLQLQMEQLENEYELQLSSYERLKKSLLELCKQEKDLAARSKRWCERYLFPPYEKPVLLNEVFTLVTHGKKLLAEKKALMNRLEQSKQFEKAFLADKEKIAMLLGADVEEPMVVIANKSLKRLEEEKNKLMEITELNSRLQHLDEQLALQKEKASFLQKEKEALFMRANANDEEEFLERSNIYKQWLDRKKELAHIESEMSELCPDEKMLKHYEKKILAMNEMTQAAEEIKEQLEREEQELRQLELRIAELNAKLKQIENKTSFSELNQQLEMKKAELAEKVKEWAVYRFSEQLLFDAKKRYETERQPYVIKKARTFFSLMTEGNYVNVFSPVGEKTFIVEHQNGLRFTPNELSQGTREQLYLAIRLALASVYQKYIPFPIIIDDILVNFDAKRREAAKNVLEEMAKEHQILFFTCHEHIAQLFHPYALYRL